MPGAPGRSPLAANLLLVAGSLVFTALLVAGVEGVLRLVHVGDPDLSRTSRLRYQQIYLPIAERARAPDGGDVWRPIDKRLPFQTLRAEKPPDALRVITFGESAVAGLGFSPNGSFSRELERMLVAAHPDRSVEVFNHGIVALSSKQIELLVADAVQRYAPDVVTIYVGNNEFLEIHAEKFAEAHATPFSRLTDRLLGTNLYRSVNYAIRGKPRLPSLAEQNFSSADLRMTQDTLIQDIEMQPAEIAAIFDAYEANLDAMVAAAQAARVPVVLMTVASNWKWRGRDDLPADWLDAVAPVQAGEPPAERLRRALTGLSAKIESSGSAERWDWRYRRAVVHESLGDYDAARADYRAAMNEDPHLRRCVDAEVERVREVAARRGAALVDTVELLQRHAAHGIIGFDEFYDYVHFTPRGNVLVAAELGRAIQRLGIADPQPGFDADAFERERLAQLAALTADATAVGDWLGVGADPAGHVSNRDLWKYDRMLKELDERIAANPRDAQGLAWRGNAAYFRLDGAPQAERDWSAALQIERDPAVEANLARLRAEARP
jgi:lysophospholipase L1-like esterase